jgi:hypothetical protein
MITIAPIGPQPVTSTTQQRARAVDGMQGHRQRLGHRAFGVADVSSQRMRLAGLDHHFLAEHTLHMWHAHRTAVVAHVQAMVLQAELAVATLAARPARAHGNAVAQREAGDSRTHRIDDARHLVAQHHGLLDANGAEAAVLVVVQVRAADAAGAHAHAHLAGADRGRGEVLDPKVARGMNDESVHDELDGGGG